MSTITGKQIKENAAYILGIARVGKLSISPNEAAEVVTNLTAVGRFFSELADDYELSVPAVEETVEENTDASD